MKKIGKRVLFALLALLPAAWLIYLLQPDVIFYFSVAWLVVIALLLWVGNRFLSRYLDRRMPWSVYGNWRFFTQLIVGLFYLLIIVNVIYLGIRLSLTDRLPTTEQIIVMNTWGAVIFIPVFSLYFSLYFLRYWRQSEVRMAESEKEKVRSQLDSLKNHLDPHFLFNNLNILASLVEKDSGASKTFIEKFADVYRTLLRTKSEDLIPLGEELSFIESYMYLIYVRFENNIRFTTQLSPAAKSKLIPPLTLQMLIENAIKHNMITESKPLEIEVTDFDNSLRVRNTFYKKREEEAVGGSGLRNIQNRYRHFTDREVRVQQTETHFEVTVPLLELETV